MLMNRLRKHVFMFGSSLIMTGIVLVSAIGVNAQQSEPTRVRFAAGSYCGSYSGDFSGGREFVLGLARGQTFTSRNIGRGTQYDVYLYGPNGRIEGRQVSPNQIDYMIRETGDHYIYIESTTRYGSVEFCAY